MKDITISAHVRLRGNFDALLHLRGHCASMGVAVHLSVEEELHLREASYSNGVTIMSDRGFDIYKAPSASDGLKTTKQIHIMCFELATAAATAAVALHRGRPVR